MERETRSSGRSTDETGDFLEHVPVGLMSFGDDGIVDRVNQTLLTLLGFTETEVVGSHIEGIFSIGTRIFYQTHWFPLLRLHGRADEIFLMLRSRGGEHIGALVNAVRREQAGRSIYDCAVMRVRERQKYEEELLRARRVAEEAKASLEERQRELELARAAAEEANRAKSTFLAVMSHELRTPLNAIAGYTDLIDLGVQGPVTDAQRDSLTRIKRSQWHLLQLINDVLNLARIEAGRVDYRFEDLPVSGVVGEVTPMVEPQIATGGLQLEVSVQPDHAVHADREKVVQVLLNLLSNAVKFTPVGGTIVISSEAVASEGAVRIQVRDTGIGIPPENLENVFEPFTQVKTRTSKGQEGTGLGLAISRDLARGMGGDLWAESRPGAGSTFTLELPEPGGLRTKLQNVSSA